jgi:hypothetical protein
MARHLVSKPETLLEDVWMAGILLCHLLGHWDAQHSVTCVERNMPSPGLVSTLFMENDRNSAKLVRRMRLEGGIPLRSLVPRRPARRIKKKLRTHSPGFGTKLEAWTRFEDRNVAAAQLGHALGTSINIMQPLALFFIISRFIQLRRCAFYPVVGILA